MYEKESWFYKLLKLIGLIKPHEISKKEMCECAKTVCNSNCESCVWHEKKISTMNSVDVYCGWYRDTVVSIEPRIIDDIVFEIPCLECKGTGIWNYFTEEIPPEICNVCKGSGRQYLGV